MARKIRNVFLKCFLLSFILLILGHIIYYYNINGITNIASAIYGVDATTTKAIAFISFNIMKIIAVFGFLIPALAINCEFITCCCMKKKDN